MLGLWVVFHGGFLVGFNGFLVLGLGWVGFGFKLGLGLGSDGLSPSSSSRTDLVLQFINLG